MTEMSLNSHNPRVEVRPATKEDLLEVSGLDELPSTVRAVTFLLDGEPSGIGGVRYENGYYLAFSDIKEDINVSKATIFRCGLEVMKMVKSMGITAYPVKSNELPSADRFLKALGSKFKNSDEVGDVYEWHS